MTALDVGSLFMDIHLISQKFYDHSTYFRGYSDSTLRRYRQVIEFYCNHARVEDSSEISDENVRELFYWGRTARDWTPNTFVGYLKTLTVFFRWCVEEGYLEQNPAEDIEAPRIEKRLPPKLTKQKAMRLLETAYNFPYKYKFLRYRNHAIFATFLFAGLRKQELLSLKYGDVDLENASIFVRQGKGNKDRVVPICYRLSDSLKKYLVERQRLQKDCPEFFTSLNRNMGFTDSGLKRLVEKMKTATGFKFSVHKLRHTFATLMLEGGCDIYSLSRMMGHSDIKTTTIYLAASAEHLRSQITKHPMNDL